MTHTFRWLIISETRTSENFSWNIYDLVWSLNSPNLTLEMIIKQLVSLTHLTLNRWWIYSFWRSKTGLRVECLLENTLAQCFEPINSHKPPTHFGHKDDFGCMIIYHWYIKLLRNWLQQKFFASYIRAFPSLTIRSF